MNTQVLLKHICPFERFYTGYKIQYGKNIVIIKVKIILNKKQNRMH